MNEAVLISDWPAVSPSPSRFEDLGQAKEVCSHDASAVVARAVVAKQAARALDRRTSAGEIMDMPLGRPLTEDDPQFWEEFEAELLAMDDAEARSHLEAGFPVYVCEDDTPEGCVIKINPDGRRQLVKHSRNNDEVVRDL